MIVGLIAVCFAVTVVVIVGSQSRAKAGAISQNVLGPVLLVPGYGGSTTSLQVLATRLRAAGRDAEVIDVPDGGKGDLNVQAETLDTDAHAALKRTGAASVDVVGYSAGGVVARLWVRDHGGASIARRIVTLGSPQHGTEIADLGAAVASSLCPLACQQLGTNSDLLAALNSGDETPAGPTFVSIWTTHDNVVLPPDSARLAGAAVNITVQTVCSADTVNHTGLPTDVVVDHMVAAELIAGAPPTLTSADCKRFSS
jgi:triacylglycerol lipase